MALVVLALAALSTEAVSMREELQDLGESHAKEALSPLEYLRAQAAAIRKKMALEHEAPAMGIGEGGAEAHGKDAKPVQDVASGTNKRNARSPEQQAGATVFDHLKSSPTDAQAVKDSGLKMPGPFGDDPITKKMTPQQQQQLLEILNEYNEKKKGTLKKELVEKKAKTTKTQAALDAAKAEQAKRAHKAATAEKAGSGKPVEKEESQDTRTSVKKLSVSSSMTSLKAMASAAKKDISNRQKRQRALTAVLKMAKQKLGVLKAKLAKHEKQKAALQMESSKEHSKVHEHPSAGKKIAGPSENHESSKNHEFRRSPVDPVAAYTAKATDFAQRLDKLAGLKKALETNLHNSEKQLRMDQAALERKMGTDMKKIKNQSHKLGAMAKKVEHQRSAMKQELVGDLKSIKAQLANDRAARAALAMSRLEKTAAKNAAVEQAAATKVKRVLAQKVVPKAAPKPKSAPPSSDVHSTGTNEQGAVSPEQAPGAGLFDQQTQRVKKLSSHRPPKHNIPEDRLDAQYSAAQTVLSNMANEPISHLMGESSTSAPSAKGTTAQVPPAAASPKQSSNKAPAANEFKAAEDRAMAVLPGHAHSDDVQASGTKGTTTSDKVDRPTAPATAAAPVKAAASPAAPVKAAASPAAPVKAAASPAAPVKAAASPAAPVKAAVVPAAPAKAAVVPAAPAKEAPAPAKAAPTTRTVATSVNGDAPAAAPDSSPTNESQGARMQQKQREAAENAATKAARTAEDVATKSKGNIASMQQEAEMAAQKTAAAEESKSTVAPAASTSVAPAAPKIAASQTAAPAAPTSVAPAAPKTAPAQASGNGASATASTAVLSPTDQSALQQRAEVAAEENVAHAQKKNDLKNMQKEQSLVEQAEVRHAKGEKPPSEVAKAAAEMEAEQVLEKENEAAAANKRHGKQVVHQVDGPASKRVVKANKQTKSTKKSAPQHTAAKHAKPKPQEQKASQVEKYKTQPDNSASSTFAVLAKKAEKLAERTVVAEDAAKERTNKGRLASSVARLLEEGVESA